MLKIVHIAKPVGGVGVYIDLLTQHLNKDNFKHIILYNEEEVDLQANPLREIFHIPLIREIKPVRDFRCLLQIITLLKELKPDRIHCHSAKAGILGRLAGAYLKISTVYTPHAYSYLSAESNFKRLFFKSIEKAFRVFPAKTIACSYSEYNRTINDLKFEEKKVFLWKNSIADIIKKKQETTKSKLPKHFICSIGRPSYQKNTELLVETILEVKKSIKEIQLVILGVGFYSPFYKKVENFIKKNDLSNNITLIPWLQREEVIEVLRKSKFYISTSRYEGLPYSIIEALALSKPCIVTSVDGNKDLIKTNYNGFLIKDDSLKLSQAVIELFKNEDLLKRMSIGARKTFEDNYNIEKTITQLETIYFE